MRSISNSDGLCGPWVSLVVEKTVRLGLLKTCKCQVLGPSFGLFEDRHLQAFQQCWNTRNLCWHNFSREGYFYCFVEVQCTLTTTSNQRRFSLASSNQPIDESRRKGDETRLGSPRPLPLYKPCWLHESDQLSLFSSGNVTVTFTGKHLPLDLFVSCIECCSKLCKACLHLRNAGRAPWRMFGKQ